MFERRDYCKKILEVLQSSLVKPGALWPLLALHIFVCPQVGSILLLRLTLCIIGFASDKGTPHKVRIPRS